MDSDSLLDALAERATSCRGRSFPLRAPAKVNLRLRVLGRLPNGYHTLSMVNGAISLADEIACSFHEGSGIELEMTPPLPGTSVLQNLVTKAVVSFVDEFICAESHPRIARLNENTINADDLRRLPFKLAVKIEKKIPTGGGLGGGSSDAAAVLRLLVSLFSQDVCASLGISEEIFLTRVLAVAARCGADVPYSFYGGFAWVQGVGERVTPLSQFPPDLSPSDTKVLVVLPPFGSATKAFYEGFRTQVPTIHDSTEECECELSKGEIPPLSRLLRNDFEGVLCQLYPAIGEFLAVMRRFFPGRASITGSGSTLFAILRSGDESAVEELKCEISRLGGTCAVTSWE